MLELPRTFIQVKPFKFEIFFLNTFTAKIIYENLPIRGNINFWGKEIYFYTDLQIKQESNSKEIVSKGELAYWPKGNAIVIGYGPTPISVGNEIRLAEKCNIWGRTNFALDKLNILNDNDEILVSKQDNYL